MIVAPWKTSTECKQAALNLLLSATKLTDDQARMQLAGAQVFAILATVPDPPTVHTMEPPPTDSSWLETERGK